MNAAARFIANTSAFPSAVGDGGLTKREYFAAAAMQGLCANSVPGSHDSFPGKSLPGIAVLYADELIVELAKAVRS